MLHAVSTWLLVAAFAGAGLVNAVGTSAAKSNFVRWGYPGWWCYLTGGLEVAAAVLIAVCSVREVGLILGGAIVAAAVVTVVRHREPSHLAPLGVFLALMVLVQLSA
jgi:hypothetical protein